MSLPVTAIARVGVLTRDCRAAAAEYARFFGINDWRVADCSGRTGDGHDYSHRQAVGYGNGVGIELIEPKSGVWADALDRCGEGPSHVVIPAPDWAAVTQAQTAAELATLADPKFKHGEQLRTLDEVDRTLSVSAKRSHQALLAVQAQRARLMARGAIRPR